MKEFIYYFFCRFNNISENNHYEMSEGRLLLVLSDSPR